MAKRPVSRSKKPVRNAAAIEEAKFVKMSEVAVLGVHITTEIEKLRSQLVTATGVPIERKSVIWRALRRAVLARMLLRTGFRRFEACGAICGDFEDGAEPKLWTTGKGNRRSYTPLPPPAVDTLREWIQFKQIVGEEIGAEAPLFCGRAGQFMSFEMIRQEWSQVLREAGLPVYKLHASRHTAGLLVLAATGDIRKVGRFLRHDGITVTQATYSHVDPAQLRRELRAVELWP